MFLRCLIGTARFIAKSGLLLGKSLHLLLSRRIRRNRLRSKTRASSRGESQRSQD
jgi:hypothetical protein